MIQFPPERSERCVYLASAAWGGSLIWFLVALGAGAAWVGPGPAFLAWTAPAALLAALTWRWLAAFGAQPPRRKTVLGLVAWTVLAFVAWDSGDRYVPEWLFPAAWVLLIGFPFGVTAIMRRLAQQAWPVVPAA